MKFFKSVIQLTASARVRGTTISALGEEGTSKVVVPAAAETMIHKCSKTSGRFPPEKNQRDNQGESNKK